MDLGHGMIQNPAAEVAEVVEYLLACEKTLASLYTLADCLISWQVTSCEAVVVRSRTQRGTVTVYLSRSHMSLNTRASMRQPFYIAPCLRHISFRGVIP